MGQIIFLIGKSGTGKTYSMRNFPSDKLFIINVNGKLLSCVRDENGKPNPVMGVKSVTTDKSDDIIDALKTSIKDGYKSVVIDDYQYTMANEFMRRSYEKGFDKFTEIGRHAWDIVNAVRELPEDIIVYVMSHTDRDDEGNEKIKTIGKLLDEKICLEGMSTIVLKTNVTDGVYTFLTQNSGKDTVKSPAGMFPSYAIDNDLYYVDSKIRSYYNLGTDFLTDEEMAEIDEINKREEIEPPKPRSERKRRESQAEPERKQRKSREQVQSENDLKVANAGLDEANGAEEVPFEEVKEPELETPPRRRRVRTE